jgi:peptidoglycan/LPS O-acetylase OafA/YrhL/lysophospholipase L1-like esterase
MSANVTHRWVDRLKGFGLLWIFANHAAEQTWGGPHIANPSADWAPLADRFSQLAPLSGQGAWDPLLNVLRWFGYLGDQGVALFILLSGFGLTWGLLQRGAPAEVPYGSFLRTRLVRIFPAYWLAHLPFFGLCLVTGFGLSVFEWQTWASLLGLRVTPSSLYHFSPAWWYVGLALQLYLLFPPLWRVLRARGPGALVLVGVALPLLVRGVALLSTDTWLDLWSRGGIAVSRLPEFVAGMCLAHAWHADAAGLDARLRRPGLRLAALVLYVAGFLASATLVGMTVAPLFMVVGLFPFLYALAARPGDAADDSRGRDPLAWVGRNSYPLFLVHHPVLLDIMPVGFVATPLMILGRAMAAFAATLVFGVGLGWVTARVEALGGRLGVRRVLIGLGAAAALCVAGLFGAELAVRRFAPQEVDGWGERASLRPDDTFGWTLIPDRETRLRWQSYDYTVQANALGFPGPTPEEARTRRALRVMTFGDAFTSAEGVDTAGSWARLLEPRLRQTLLRGSNDAEVQNFAVTGYGPTQYAALARTFLPRFRPDVLVMTFFINDFADARTSYDAFREEIGFGLPLPEGPLSVVKFAQLRRFVALRLHDRWNAWRGAERVFGFGLGHFDKLLVRPPERDAADQAALRARYAEVAEAARAVGAHVLVPVIPSGPQVCSRDALPYFPPAVDLKDPKFDVERPQRLALPIIAETGFEALDLRPVLKALPACPYQPENMHWLPEGHAAVAEAVARALGR